MVTFRTLCLLVCSLLIGAVASPASAAQQDEAAETQRLQQECNNGRGPVEACASFGHRLYSGIGITADHPTALGVFRAACERDSAASCSNVGVVLTWSNVVPHDLPQALTFFERACARSWVAACMQVGHMYREGTGTAISGLKAIDAYTEVCIAMNGEGCRRRGRIQADGLTDAPQRERDAVSSFETGCLLNDMEACALIGYMAQNGRGMVQDGEVAVRRHMQACTGGVAFACGNVEAIRNAGAGTFGYDVLMKREAAMHAFPPTLPIEQRYILVSAAFANGDAALAVTGYKLLAEAGMADAAYTLGQILYEGRGGVAQNVPDSFPYFKQAADQNHPYALFVMAQFYRSGTMVPFNDATAIRLMQAAHANGLAEAGPIALEWHNQREAWFAARDARLRADAIESERSAYAADNANIARVWGLYSNSQNRQENGQVCGTIYRNNQAHHECMARETFDAYYNPNR